MTAHGLMLHHFHDQRHPAGQGAITADQFAAMLEFIGIEHFLTPEEWLDRAASGRLRPSDRCITFDDALLCQYEIALPVLQRYGLMAFWFIYSSVFEGNVERLELYRHFRTVRFADIDGFYTAFFDRVAVSDFGDDAARALAGFDPDSYLQEFSFYSASDRRFRFLRDKVLGVDKYNRIMDALIEADSGYAMAEAAQSLWMTNDHLKTLHRQGHEIGLHSYSHPTRMEDLAPDLQHAEYSKNFAHISSIIGTAPRSMSHPCGSYSDDTLGVLRELGMVLGFRANLAKTQANAFEFARDDHSHILARMKSA